MGSDFSEATATEAVVASFASTPDARLREVMESLTRHLHGFVREVEPTQGEWGSAIGFLTQVGHLCDDRRQEFILLSDVLGVSMLVDAINNRRPVGATESTVLGPFHVIESPARALGDDLAETHDTPRCLVRGRVLDLDGRPIAGALVDAWQADDQGFYDVQKADVAAPDLRGLFTTDEAGRFWFRRAAPTSTTTPSSASRRASCGRSRSRTTWRRRRRWTCPTRSRSSTSTSPWPGPDRARGAQSGMPLSRRLTACSASRAAWRSASECRLSQDFLPRASAISTLARPSLK
jgi:hypothetical protein